MVMFVVHVHLLPVPEKLRLPWSHGTHMLALSVFIIFSVITQSEPFCLNPPPALRLGLYLNHNSVE